MTITNNKMVVLTALLCLVPIIFGLIFWNDLPEAVPTHFGADNQPDGWSSKPFAVFGLPFIIMALHLACVFGTKADPKYRNINGKMLSFVLWICPVISNLCGGLMYSFALGREVNIGLWLTLLIGIVFIVVGNYLPKSRQNYTVGIKIPWTLSDAENWNATHRFAGRLWMVAGIVILGTAWLGQMLVFIPIVVLMVAAPVLYSYLHFRKNH